MVPMPLSGFGLHVVSVRGMTIFVVQFPNRLLLKQYNLDKGLSQHRLK